MQSASLAACLALLVPVLAPAQQRPTVAEATDWLISRQQADGTFDTAGIVIDSQLRGITALCGLAVLSERGLDPSVQKTVEYFLGVQDGDGLFLDREQRGFHRAMIQQGMIEQLLLEVLVGVREGRYQAKSAFVTALEQGAKNGALCILRTQHDDGAWCYDPKGIAKPLGDYTESAIWVPCLESLLLARDSARLIELPGDFLQRALTYIRTRVKDGGFINGANQTDVSPNMTPAVASVLCRLRDLAGVPELLTGARGYLQQTSATWFDGTNTGKLGISRRMYGLLYTALLGKRDGDAASFAAVHARCLLNLEKHRADTGLWRSSIGDAGTTALAVLIHNVAKDTLCWFRRQDPQAPDAFLTPDRLKAVAVAGEPKRPTHAKVGVVLIEFPDQKHPAALSREAYRKMLFTDDTYRGTNEFGEQVFGSLRDYYREVSYGAFEVSGSVFDWVEAKDATWAQVRKNEFQRKQLDELLVAALDATGADVSEMTHLVFLYHATRKEIAKGSPFWPHAGKLDYRGKKYGMNIIDTGTEKITGVGVFAHELGHTFGITDKYGLIRLRGAGGWCLMGSGSHGDELDRPLDPDGSGDRSPFHFCAYCKMQLGWLQVPAVDPRVAQKVLLRPIEKHADAVRVLLKEDGSEYYLLENRQRQGFERGLPGPGLLVWYVKAKTDPRLLSLNAQTQDLVEGHALATPDSAWKFAPMVPLPQLFSSDFTPDSVPGSRRDPSHLEVVLRNIRLDAEGNCRFEIGGTATRSDHVSFGGEQYRLSWPKRTAAKELSLALVLGDFGDAPAADQVTRRFRDFFFEHGPRVRFRDEQNVLIGTLSNSAADWIWQASYGAVKLTGRSLSWEKQAWVRAGEQRSEFTTKGLSGLLEAAAGKSEDNQKSVAEAACFGFVLTGAPVNGNLVVGERPAFVIDSDNATRDLALSLRALGRALRMPDHAHPWCRAGHTEFTKEKRIPGPGYPCALCREAIGWLEPLVAAEGRVALAPTNVYAGQAVRIPLEGEDHVLVENRSRMEFDGALPVDGLLVWHVTQKDCGCDAMHRNGKGKGRGETAACGVHVHGVRTDPRGNVYFQISRLH